MSDEHIVVQLMHQLLDQNSSEFKTLNAKLDRLEFRVEAHDRDLALGKRMLRDIAAVIMTGLSLLVWFWP